MIPNFSKVRNSSLVGISFSGESLRAWAWTGGPWVTMWCLMPCLGFSNAKVGVTNSGLPCRSFVNSLELEEALVILQTLAGTSLRLLLMMRSRSARMILRSEVYEEPVGLEEVDP